MERKAQAALEFLMTYGWAILVVLAAIGALAYFGVLNPSNLLPDKCTASPGTGCIGSPLLNTTQAVFTVTNGHGFPLVLGSSAVVASIPTGSIYFCDKGGINNCVLFPAAKTWSEGQDLTWKLAYTAPVAAGSTLKVVLTLNYTDPVSGLPNQDIIEVSGKIR